MSGLARKRKSAAEIPRGFVSGTHRRHSHVLTAKSRALLFPTKKARSRPIKRLRHRLSCRRPRIPRHPPPKPS